MTDIYLKTGESNPSDIKLVDPTQPLGPAVRNCSLAIIEAQDIPADVAVVIIAESLAVSEANDSSALVVTVKVNTSLTVTENQDISIMAAGVRISGVLAITELSDTIIMTGNVNIIESFAVTESQDISIFASIAQISGSLEIIETPDALDSLVKDVISGVLSVIEEIDIPVINGMVPIVIDITTEDEKDIPQIEAILEGLESRNLSLYGIEYDDTINANIATITRRPRVVSGSFDFEQYQRTTAYLKLRKIYTATIKEGPDIVEIISSVQGKTILSITESLDTTNSVIASGKLEYQRQLRRRKDEAEIIEFLLAA